MKKLHTLILASALGCALSTYAFAHGDEVHATKTSVVKKEQKDWGIAGDARKFKRTIKVSMRDTMRFSPDKITVKQGETIKFVIKNTGAVLHEFVIGTQKENDEHAALMLKFPNMEHSEPYMAHVPPGKTGEIIWTFNQAGDFDFACLIAGHFQAGMRGTIQVLAPGKAATAAAAPSAPAKAVAVTASPVATAPASTAMSAQATAAPVQAAPPKAMAAGEMTEAEVRKVDVESKKVTLKHGPIKNLDMPGMTMVFQVRDPALFDKLVVGEKIMFSAVQQQGAYVLTGAEKMLAK